MRTRRLGMGTPYTVAGMLVRLLDRLVPPNHHTDPIRTRKGRLLVGVLLLLCLPLPGFFVIQALQAQWLLLGLSVTALLLFGALLVIFRVTGQRVLVTQLLLMVGSLAVLAASWQTGGLRAPALSNLPVTAMLAFVLIGPRWGYVWTGPDL